MHYQIFQIYIILLIKTNLEYYNMSDKIKIREVVESIFGIDEGSADHIMYIDKFLEKVNKLNENGYLSKNQGRIFYQ